MPRYTVVVEETEVVEREFDVEADTQAAAEATARELAIAEGRHALAARTFNRETYIKEQTA